ncbi:MAG: hypothetical protein RMZ41_001715 [Nostoc sp. DedVER02]|uniref:hypothetical protein n=1 Tax=unclassified Nostoc TaxID=2593658 RepID=UPI002AD4B70E|nr:MULTISPECIES: hypothetical protein [unclassified Nostoc]MDZ7987124.1 hypothetical protein [Nostoc sp. DedVER02]MDZ8111006.1 hypothetical protein [Nostoc sp. DedVER01b]
MARKPVIEEVKELDKVEAALPEVEKSGEFQATYNQDEQTVDFELTDGTPVQVKSPKAKQILLLEGFINTAPQEYKTDSFAMLKLASLCVTKFGDKAKLSFEELLELLELEDIERVAAAIGYFRDKLAYLGKKAKD